MAIALTSDSAQLRLQCQVALDFAAVQCDRLLSDHPGHVPMYTVEGRWNREGERWTHWCEGFYPGIFWLLHAHTNDEKWARAARQLSRPLEPRRFDRHVHDLGFLFFSTYFREYRRTGDSRLRDILIDAGRTLALRRQPGGYLASFIGPESLFIDIMMNVGIIFYAANATGDQALRRIALDHCRVTAKHLVRQDGSTAHEGIFDVESGRFLRQSTQQGWAPESTWTRGQAWAIYGFTAAARLSGESEFLDVARRCADQYMSRCPADGVPVFDFDLPPDAPQLVDSSASAIAASGLIDLAIATGEDRYRQAALTMLTTLCSHRYLANSRPDWEGILLHGIYHYHKNLGVDESVAWGDHFFVESLVKTLHGQEAAW